MTDYVAIVTFAEKATTYQAYSELKNSSVINQVRAAALVERAADGSLSVAEGGDTASGVGLAGGSLIGMLVGALGGPLGLLLGWGAGALTGSAVDADRADANTATLLATGGTIVPGGNALVLETSEDDTAALDQFVAGHGGVLVRREEAEVISELEAQEAAAVAAQQAADEAIRQQKKEERQEKREDRIAKLKAKFKH